MKFYKELPLHKNLVIHKSHELVVTARVEYGYIWPQLRLYVIDVRFAIR